MSSVVEGVCTVKIKVSELVKKDKANTELERARSYDRMYYVTYGPFTAGKYKFEVRVRPIDEGLKFYLCFLENSGEFQRCGYVSLLQDHNSSSNWTMHGFTRRLNNEEAFEFKADSVQARGLPMVYIAYVLNNEMQRYSKDDCLVAKFAIWVLLDDSKLGPPKPVPQPDQNPSQPKKLPPDIIGTLLEGQFADVHFTVKDQTFAAHRAILAARSSVFRSELLALQDSNTCCNKLCFSIQNIDALTFKCLLHFIYTDSLPSDFEETTQRYHLMFIAAYRFEIEGLKSICEAKLTKAVTDSITTTLELMEDQECGLFRLVQKDCGIKPEVITTTTSVTKIGDRLYGTSITE